MDRTTRRRVLATGASALAIGIAGCGGGGGDGGGDGDGGGGNGDGGGGNGDGGGGNGDGGGGDGDGGGTTVEMNDDLQFVPETIEVSTGTTVTWENAGNLGHTVTAYEDDIPDGADYWASGGFDSEQAARDAYPDEGEVAAGETYEHTFETSGTHGYFCIPHEGGGMTGTVEVG